MRVPKPVMKNGVTASIADNRHTYHLREKRHFFPSVQIAKSLAGDLAGYLANGLAGHLAGDLAAALAGA